MANKRILVSCGQETDKEIRLGRDIINVIGNHKGMGGFFSQHVHSPADLNSGVFAALKTCDGFFAVMHKRGGITYRNYPVTHRSSVWIQQEIAIGRAPDRDLLLNHPDVSRLHAGIKEITGRFYLVNLSSSKRTLLSCCGELILN